MELKRILLVLEYEQDNSVILQRARRLLASAAAASPGEQVVLHLFVADYSDSLDRTYLFDTVALEHARQGFIGARQKWLERQARPFVEDGFQVECSAHWGKPRYLVYLDEAEAQGADLILKTTHRHSTLGRALLAPGDWHLIRETRVPLWLVRDSAWGDHVRVAACVDPLHEKEDDNGRDRRLLAQARELAAALPAELHVIHAYEPMSTGLIAEFDALLAESAPVREEVRLRHEQAFDRLVEGEAEPSTRCHLEEGEAVTVIPEVVSRESIDLVVMGAVARTGLQRLLIGSTAEQVLDSIEADLLILK